MKDLTPEEIVKELDKYIIGQEEAKKAVAIALRNRWRRQKLPPELREEVAPKNIIMIGPTGVGKTEIARRLSRLANAPFIKVEASKFTEVGYVGRDVDSMVRDLMEIAVNMVKEEIRQKLADKAKALAEERLLDLLLPSVRRARKTEEALQYNNPEDKTREKLRTMLREGKLDNRYVELEVKEKFIPIIEVFSGAGLEELGINIKDFMPNFFPTRTRKRRVKVKEALEILAKEEEQKLIDMDEVVKLAKERVEQSGIIFIDEIDKIAGKRSSDQIDVSREGVQRDLLPIVEGSTVITKYGAVRTDHILFIAAGAFHVSKPSDLIPELQGRFPIRVELKPLTAEDFVRILKEPENSLIKQYTALLSTEGVEIEFTDDAIEAIASIAAKVNERTENIGARRLHTVMEKLLEDISFKAPSLKGKKIKIDADYVYEKLKDIVEDEDLSKYIL